MSVWNLYMWPTFEEGHFGVNVRTYGWHPPGLEWTLTTLTSLLGEKEGKQTQRRSWEDRGKGKHHTLKFPGPQKLEEGHGTLSIRASRRNRPCCCFSDFYYDEKISILSHLVCGNL